MGARQSKRSVDITTTPKKGEGEVAINEEKIEKLGDADVKAVVTNGTAAHADIEFADKDETAKEAAELGEVKENGLPENEGGDKTPNEQDAVAATAPPAAGDQPVAATEKPADETVATVESEKTVENGEKAAETPETKKQKEKKKKKWSLRSISFSKKDKSKPNKDKEKNGDVEEEKAESAVTSPTEPEKTDETKTPTEEPTSPPMTNGDASKEDLKKVEAQPSVETTKIVEEPAETPASPPPTPSSVVESAEVKTPDVVEATPPVPVAEETKNEVRNLEETPLPSVEPETTPIPLQVPDVENPADIPLPPPETTPTEIVENVSVVPEQQTQETPAVITVEKSDESIDNETEQNSIKTEDSIVSTPSVSAIIVEEKMPIVSSAGDMPITESCQISENEESKDAIIEPINNVDSLPDLSTESLPSLPEPADSLLEPMSLPPLDSVPEPLVDEVVEIEETPQPLTNGNAKATSNGFKSSPVDDEETSPPLPSSSPSLDGPLKQVICPEPVVDAMNDENHDASLVNTETTVATSE